MTLSKNEREELWNIYTNGPVWDGDIIGPGQRDRLTKLGYVVRHEGYNHITDAGIQALKRKETP